MPPVVATLTATITEFATNITAAGEELVAMGAEASTMAAEVNAGMTEAEAGVGRFTGTLELEATKVTASNEEIMASFAALSASVDKNAEQLYLDFDMMAAKSQRMAASMEAANAKAVASTEAMGAKIDAVAAESTGFGAAMEGASKKLMLVGAAGAIVAIATGKMAADLESSTTRLVTSAGEVESNLAGVRDGILSMAGQVGYSSEELSKAMYTIESGGQHGAEGLKVLRAAAEGAKTENAELKTVADAVTSVLVDYHLKADDAASVTSKLVAATSAGKTTFEELSGAMSAVLPVASAAHVSLDDILGDLAAMTVHGMSAQQSAQNLTDVIRHMQSPTAVQSKELALLGINAQDLSTNLGTKGLSGTLQEIANRIQSSLGPGAQKVILDLGTALKTLPKDVQALGQKLIDGTITQAGYNKEAKAFDPIAAHQAAAFATLAASTHTIGGAQMTGGEVMQSYGQALNKATGDATGLNVALMLTGENADVTNGAIKTVASAATEAGNHVKGWAEIQQTFNQKAAEAKDGLGAMAIAIGQKLLPVMSAIIGVIGTVTAFIADNKAAATTAAVVIGVLLVAGLVGATVAVWNFTVALLANPVVWIVIAIMALVAAIILLIKNWDHVSAWLKSTWSSFIKWAKGVWDGFAKFWSDLWDKIWKWCSDRVSDVVNFCVSTFHAVINWIVARWNGFLQFWVDLWNKIWKWCTDKLTDMNTWVHDRIQDILGFFGWLGSLPGKVAKWFGDVKDAIVRKFQEAVDWIADIPNKILRALGDLGGLLWKAGGAIIQGLWDGLKAAWKKVTDWVSGIGSWISDHKGPIEVDRVLLTPHGNAIMDGLLGGLKTGGAKVQTYLDAFTTDIGTIGTNVAVGVSGGLIPSVGVGAMTARGGAGQSGTVVNVIVQGSVVAERDLMNLVQTLTLRYNGRNSSNGLTTGVR